MPRRFFMLIACTAAALTAWALLPTTFIDRGLFSLTARTFAEPPFFITGKGSADSALTLHIAKRHVKTPTIPLPDISITDDPDRVFQTAPPSPVDFAIILKNLRRLGRESIAIGMPLAWPEPDVISLIALDQQLDALPSVVTAAPLSRGAIPSPLPPAFRRASIAVSEIHGNGHDLPLVNRVSIPNVLLGNTSSLAGFTALESEPDSRLPYLLARWEDRVVFSFQLLAALAHHQVSPEKIEIRLGEFIALGTDGPFIPIDDFGRLTFAPPASNHSSSIPAETLIDAPDDFLATHRAGAVLIRNGMSAADVSSLRFSETLVSTVSLLANPTGTSTPRAFHRIPKLSELLLIAALISLLHGLGNFQKTRNHLTLLLLAGVIVTLHFISVPTTGTWLPTLPALAAVFTAIPFTPRRNHHAVKSEMSKTIVREVIQPEHAKPNFPAPATSPAPIKTAKKSAKKGAKKSPSKKSPRKRKGR